MGKRSDELVEAWLSEYLVNDQKECMTIGDMASKKIFEHANIGITDKTVLVFYAVVYDEIVKTLVDKRADESAFAIDVAGAIKIGYDDIEDDGVSETQGNFNIFIQDGDGKKAVWSDVASLHSVDRCVQWLEANLDGDNQRKILESIAVASLKTLQEKFAIALGSWEVVFPMWHTIHERVVNFVKVERAAENASDYFINFCGLYEIHCQLFADNEVGIVYKTEIYDKLSTKDNLTASSISE